MMIAAVHPAGFKIRSTSDLAKAVYEYITKDHEFPIVIDKQTALFICNDSKRGLIVSMKYGDLHDVFNPQIVVPQDRALSHLWQYRKHINARFFFS